MFVIANAELRYCIRPRNVHVSNSLCIGNAFCAHDMSVFVFLRSCVNCMYRACEMLMLHSFQEQFLLFHMQKGRISVDGVPFACMICQILVFRQHRAQVVFMWMQIASINYTYHVFKLLIFHQHRDQRLLLQMQKYCIPLDCAPSARISMLMPC